MGDAGANRDHPADFGDGGRADREGRLSGDGLGGLTARTLAASATGVLHRQHADITADIGVPDITAAVDSDTARPCALPRQFERLYAAIRQSAQTPAAQHSEPNGPVAGNGETGQYRAVLGNLVVLEQSILQSADAVLAKLDE